MTPEGLIKKEIKKLLDGYGDRLYYFMPVQAGYGKRTVDFLISLEGFFLAIEAKAPGKPLRKIQEKVLMQIKATGGETRVIDGPEGIEELAALLAQAKKLIKETNDYVVRRGAQSDHLPPA